MAKTIQLSIMTPTQKFYDAEISYVLLHTTEGEMVVMPGHIALTCALNYGIAKIVVNEEEHKAVIMGGFVEVTPNKITLLTDVAEWPNEIDIHRAQAAKERALRHITEGGGSDIERANLAIRRAKLRLQATGHRPKDSGF